MRILIAGCGDVGNALALKLLQNDHVVYGLKRDISTLPAQVEAVPADLTNPSTLTGLPENIDRLVFMPTPASRDRAAYEAVFIDGWKNLWSSLKQPPGRTILASSTAVFGHSDGSIVDERTPPAPCRFNGQVLLDMEQLAASCTDHLVVVRIAGIYGPGREGMLRLAASPDLEIQCHPPYFTNRIHLEDVSAALLHLLFVAAPDGLYLACDDQPAPRYEVMEWLAKALGKSAPTGLTVANGAGGKRVDNRRLRRSGFRLRFPDYRAGYGAILAGTRNRSSNETTN